MTYEAPSGWTERLDDTEGAIRYVFHRQASCPRVRDRGALLRVDRPYSARRCTRCASIRDSG